MESLKSMKEKPTIHFAHHTWGETFCGKELFRIGRIVKTSNQWKKVSCAECLKVKMISLKNERSTR